MQADTQSQANMQLPLNYDLYCGQHFVNYLNKATLVGGAHLKSQQGCYRSQVVNFINITACVSVCLCRERNAEMLSCCVNTVPGQAETSGKYETLLLSSIKILSRSYHLEKAQ